MSEPASRTPADTWSAVLGQLQCAVTSANYATWLRDTVGLRHDDGRFVVGAQNEFVVEWLHVRLRDVISKTLARVLGHPADLAFEVIRLEDEPAPALLLAPDEAAPAAPPPPRPQLHPALTFDTFVVGDENRMAFQAARGVVDAADPPNPLAIFGATGLGKTHLLNAIGHAAAGRMRVVYATAEQFANDYITHLRRQDIDAFRARYRTCDLLLLDDLQFLEGRPKFQEEFFHAFNELHARGKRIVIAADRAPARLGGISDALRSRLSWGLAVDLRLPSFATRLAILRAKAARHARPLPDDALVAIAERCCPSVRELEGYLNRVIAYTPLVGGTPTREVIASALSPFERPPDPSDARPAADAIIAAVCQRTGATPIDLRGPSRNRGVAYARHLAAYLLREDGRMSVAEIGRMLGNRDHSTVIGGATRIVKEIRTRKETVQDIAAVRAALEPVPSLQAAS